MSTLAAILTKEPEPPSRIVRGLPHDLETLIVRCLRKSPERRWQSMADLKVALLEVKDELESGEVIHVASAPADRKSRRWLIAGVAALAVLAASAVVYWYPRPESTPASSEMERLTFEVGATFSPAISPDGKLLASAG